MVTTGQSVDADPSHPCRPWRFFDELLGRHLQTSTPWTYIAVLKTKSPGSAPLLLALTHCLSLTAQPVVHSFHVFSLTTPADVTLVIHSLPITSSACLIHCRLDCWRQMPTSCHLRHLFNSSLDHGSVPSSFKSGFVVRPTTSCFADWSKRRHVTLHIIDRQEVVLTCYRIFITCHRRPLDMSTHVTRSRVTCCKYSTKMKSRVRFPADH